MKPLDFSSDPQVFSDAFRIMLVDDSPENLTLLTNMLGDHGFEIVAFPNGPLALRAAQKSLPDLVLLDITMPGMNGYQVCEQFKQEAKLAEVPIIFLSALSDTDDKVKGFRMGAVDYITKPFQIEEVHARVMTHLQLCRLRQRLEYQNRHLQELVDAKVKQLAEAHKESRKRLAEIAHMNRNITSSVYSAAIAHDLRQPLAAILSNAEAAELFLEQEPPDIDQVKEILADIRRDDRRASQIIQRMRSMLNKTQTHIEEIEINEIVADVAKFLAAEARMRAATISVEPAERALSVLADRIQLQQVLINLILNGMDAMAEMPAAERAIQVHVRATEDDSAEVAVADNGVGFEHIEQAFESFFTTKPQGMGMGLSITASLIQAHGGQIWAENNPQGGASVYFRLPLQRRHDD